MTQTGQTQDAMHEVQLFNSELRFINSLMPKTFCLMASTRQNKLAKGGLKEPEELYLEGRRLSRSKKSRDFAVDLGLAGQKSSKSVNDALKKCEQILNMVSAHRSSGPFMQPVDFEGLQLYDYPLIVKEPMDLSTIRKKLKNREYKTAGQFTSDMRKIWQNSFLYNQKYSPIYTMTLEMSDFFEKLNKELNDASTLADDLGVTHRKSREPAANAKDAGLKPAAKAGGAAKVSAEGPLSLEEQVALSGMIKNLDPDYYEGIWNIIAEDSASQNKTRELEFDIEKLHPRVARNLERYVRSKLALQAKPLKKSLPKKQPPAFPKDDLAPKTSVAQTLAPVQAKHATPPPEQPHLAVFNSEPVAAGQPEKDFSRGDTAESKSSSFFSDSEDDK